MTDQRPTPDALLTGATGFIGRWLLPEMTANGRTVAVLVRGASGRIAELQRWTRTHGGNPDLVVPFDGDLTAPGLGLGDADTAHLGSVRTVFHLAANFSFGLTKERARRDNVDASVDLLRWATRHLPALERFVMVGGYRVGGQAWRQVLDVPVGQRDAAIDRFYRRHGAYEGSKLESDLRVREAAAELGVAVTAVHPATVIGDAATGEATQFIGLADLVRDLSRGRLPALVGGRDVYLPVVPVDHVARFIAGAAEHPRAAGGAYVLLDDRTPLLPVLIDQIARHLGVASPRLRLPVGLVRRLPRSITHVEPEALSFLVADRYDTAPAHALAAELGLALPPFDETLERWLDFMVANGFGAAGPLTTDPSAEVGRR